MAREMRIKTLSIGYGSVCLAEKINLSLRFGKMYAILGLNGSGKTTLLKTLLGLIPACGGEFLVDDKNLLALTERKRAEYVAYVPQRYSEAVGITVLQMVAMGFNVRLPIFASLTKTHLDKAREMLENLGIAHLAECDFSRLSAGQKQMVILGRALIQDSPILMMDEPDSNLDYPHKHSMLSFVRELTESRSKATFVTLHDPNIAITYCHDLLVLKDGLMTRIDLQSASKAELETALQKLYGDVELIEVNDSYYMVKRKTPT